MLCGFRIQLQDLHEEKNTGEVEVVRERCDAFQMLPHTHRRRALCPTGTSRFLTYDADDEGKQVDDAVKDLDVPLRLISENSVDQDGWGENGQWSIFFKQIVDFCGKCSSLSYHTFFIC